MRELPVFGIIGRTVAFEVVNLFTLFRLTWLPLALLLAAQVALGQALARVAGGTSEELLRAAPGREFFLYVSIALQTIALSVVAVRVHRLVLFDDRRPGVYFGFPFGRTEAWYVAMVALLILFLFGLAFGFHRGIDLLAQATGGGPLLLDPRPLTADNAVPFLRSVALFTLGLAAVFLWFWFALRLMLWAPAVVAHDGLSLAQAWRATRGQPWGLFALLFVASQSVVFAGLLFTMAAGDKNPLRVTEVISERHALSLWGGYVNPDVAFFAVMPSVERLALDFAMTFFATTFTAALLSFAYVSRTENDAFAAESAA